MWTKQLMFCGYFAQLPFQQLAPGVWRVPSFTLQTFTSHWIKCNFNLRSSTASGILSLVYLFECITRAVSPMKLLFFPWYPSVSCYWHKSNVIQAKRLFVLDETAPRHLEYAVTLHLKLFPTGNKEFGSRTQDLFGLIKVSHCFTLNYHWVCCVVQGRSLYFLIWYLSLQQNPQADL